MSEDILQKSSSGFKSFATVKTFFKISQKCQKQQNINKRRTTLIGQAY
jgi:hypothetical protein